MCSQISAGSSLGWVGDGASPTLQCKGRMEQKYSRMLSMTKKSDALPVISAIVVIFVLLAIFIIVVVHYGPQLRTIQITLYQEPMPQDLDDGVHLMDWRKLGSQKKPAQPGQWEPGGSLSCQCSCRHHLPCGSIEPNVIEITYL
uniref:Small integral membrane protein 33 n=1 Tax=Coturnix japonica TaxID=93934 RepID=A0A8C2TGS0_COTJA